MSGPPPAIPPGSIPWLVAAALGLLAASFLLSVILCALTRRIAPRFGLVDRPGGRKAHKAPTPLGGGVAFWLAVGIVLVAGTLAAYLPESWFPAALVKYVRGARLRIGRLGCIYGLATLIMLMGLIDDRRGLSWWLRLLVQIGLATLFVVFVEHATVFNRNSFFTSAVTVFWIVGLTNSFNFLDNMDGLAASIGLIASLLFVGAQVAVGTLFVPAVLLVLAGSLAGFLVHNHPPARLFMGDAGSNFIGFLLGTLTVTGTFAPEGSSPFGVLAPLLVMAVPLYDTASVIFIRLREGRSPFQADRSHFSHRLVERGLTPARAVATIDLVTLAGGLGALLLHRELSPYAAGVIVAQTACLLGLVAVLEVSTPKAERRDGPAPTPRPDAEDGPAA